MRYTGSCHCKAVRFEIEAPEKLEALECNCSICAKSGDWHLILPASRFRLLAGEDMLTTYRFNTGVAKHTFCRVCGIKPFYVPRSNPDGISVNARCLDAPPDAIEVTPFDGRHWEQNAGALAARSRES